MRRGTGDQAVSVPTTISGVVRHEAFEASEATAARFGLVVLFLVVGADVLSATCVPPRQKCNFGFVNVKDVPRP